MSNESIIKNLVRLRNSLGLTQEEFAKKADISVFVYRNIEIGKTEPKFTTLQSIAEKFKVDINKLIRPARSFKNVRFRAKKDMKKREQILTSVAFWLDDFVYLENELNEKPPYLFDDIEIPSPSDKRGKIVAENARKILSSSKFNIKEDEPIRDICGLLEKAGIKIFTKEFNSDSFFGLSLKEEDCGPAITVNSWDRISVERRIFSVAHELGHLLMHFNSETYNVDETDENETEEKEADQFAGYFLMPEKTFIREWKNNTGLDFVERVFKLKGLFNVSYQVILYRLTEHLPEQKNEIWKTFYVQHKKLTGKTLSRTEEPKPLQNKDFEPNGLSQYHFRGNRLELLVKNALQSKKINLTKAATILEKTIAEMKTIKNYWNNEFILDF